MATSNVDRVRNDGFSNSRPTWRPVNAVAVGAFAPSRRADFSSADNASRRSRSSYPRSRIERKSFASRAGGGMVSTASGAVFAVDADVLGTEVARPDRCLGVSTGTEVHVDVDV